MMFAALAATMVGVKYKSDKRDVYLHHGSWAIKAALWLACNLLPFFLPVGLINAYCECRAPAPARHVATTGSPCGGACSKRQRLATPATQPPRLTSAPARPPPLQPGSRALPRRSSWASSCSSCWT